MQTKYPGEAIKFALRGSGVFQRELAQKAGIVSSQVSEMLSGKRTITPALCLALETVGVGDAETWLFMVMRYELAQERFKQAK